MRKSLSVPSMDRSGRSQSLSEVLFGWHLVRGGSYDPQTGKHTTDREYFPPAWLVWLKNKLAINRV